MSAPPNVDTRDSDGSSDSSRMGASLLRSNLIELAGSRRSCAKTGMVIAASSNAEWKLLAIRNAVDRHHSSLTIHIRGANASLGVHAVHNLSPVLTSIVVAQLARYRVSVAHLNPAVLKLQHNFGGCYRRRRAGCCIRSEERRVGKECRSRW